jgi:hypothetical protein
MPATFAALGRASIGARRTTRYAWLLRSVRARAIAERRAPATSPQGLSALSPEHPLLQPPAKRVVGLGWADRTSVAQDITHAPTSISAALASCSWAKSISLLSTPCRHGGTRTDATLVRDYDNTRHLAFVAWHSWETLSLDLANAYRVIWVPASLEARIGISVRFRTKKARSKQPTCRTISLSVSGDGDATQTLKILKQRHIVGRISWSGPRSFNESGALS